MKHVFIAHSHSIFLSALGTVDYINIPENDIIFLCTRRYQIPDGMEIGKIVDANEPFNRLDAFQGGNISEAKRFVAEFDKWVEDIVGEDYDLYLPHFASNFFKLLQTNMHCRKVSLVQEGAYTISGMFLKRISLLKKIFLYLIGIKNFGSTRVYPHGIWYTDGCLLGQKKIDVYATTDRFFQYMPKDKTVLHIIKWPSPKCNLTIEHPESPIFVFDGYVKNGIIESEIYRKCCRQLIERYHSNHNYMKFHPAQSAEEREFLRQQFIDIGVESEVFSESAPFEFYIGKFKGLRVIGFSSSLVMFAHDAGHNVSAHTSWLLVSPIFKDKVENGYPVVDY